MASGVQLSVTDLRRATRHPVEYRVIAEHRRHGDMAMTIVNVSAQGFMISDAGILARGDRVTVRLPQLGQIEAHVIWLAGERAGFQFERIIRIDEFSAVIEALQPNARLRRNR